MGEPIDTRHRIVPEVIETPFEIFETRTDSIEADAITSEASLDSRVDALEALFPVTEASITLIDTLTDNVGITKHGFAPKSPNDATKYLDGTGAYSVPAGGGTFPPALPAFPVISNLEGRFSAEPTVSALTLNTDGRVAQVNDASGAWGSNFSAVTTARPRWLKRAMNNLRPGMSFDGVAARLTAGAVKAIAQPCTVVCVVQNWALGANNANLFRDSAGGPVTFINVGNSFALFAGTVLSSAALFNQNREQVPDGMIGAPAIIMAVFNGGASIISNNGVEVAGAGGASNISGTMRIGGDSTTSFAKNILYEILFYSKALSLVERGLLNAYYAAALDITL